MDGFFKKLLILTKVNVLFLMFFAFLNWKYFLDIIFKSTKIYLGTLILGEQILTSKIEACDGEQWELFEEKGTLRFKIFSDKMSQIYNSNTLLSDMCSGIITFRYMKRSRYIIEIIQMESK